MAEPAVNQFKFDATIITPLAQVTVVDGREGDCNIVDFCRLPVPAAGADKKTKDDFVNQAWYRMIIDTGPTAVGATDSKAILNSLRLVATKLRWPAMNADTSFYIPRVRELQITHPDDDHIGNASAFLNAMATEDIVGSSRRIDKLRGCRITYSEIPPRDQKPTIAEGNPVHSVNPSKGEINTVEFVGSLAPGWVNSMERAGIYPVVMLTPTHSDWTRIEPGDNKFSVNKWNWRQPNLKDPSILQLDYAKKPVDDNTQFYLKATVNLYFEGDRNLISKRKSDKISVSTVKNFIPINRPQISLPDAIVAKFTIERTYSMDWESSATAKKAKPGGTTPKLMANMVFRPPSARDQVMDLAVSSKAFSASNPIFVRNVPQVETLGKTIAKINKMTFTDANDATKSVRAQLTVQIPKAGDASIIGAASDTTAQNGFHRILGPTPEQYGKMIRDILVLLWKYDTVDREQDLVLDGDTVNRSSVVTMFERPSSGVDQPFSMLFTGDAYDKSCDIRDTLLSWNRAQRTQLQPPVIQVDVLKVPHHGSDVTQSSGFYTYVRANTYLICGSFHNKSGNPKLSTLTAIVRGFKGKTAPNNTPFRIFFSSPLANDDYTTANKTKWRSPARALRADPILKPVLAPGPPGSDYYYYRMYMLTATPNNDYTSFGSIGWGKDAAGNVIVKWDTKKWDNISGVGT